MQVVYGLFDSAPGDERSYVADKLAAVFRAIALSGVADIANDLKVTATGTGTSLSISAGSAMILGYLVSLVEDGGGLYTLELVAGGSASRIDRVVARLDLSTDARSINLMVLQGTPSASPVPPSLTRSGEVYDLSLAQVSVQAGLTVLTQEHIRDERGDESVCGAIVPAALKLSQIGATHGHPDATAAQAGFMSAAQAARLAELAASSSPTLAGLTLTGGASVAGTLNMNGNYIDGALFR